MSEDRLRVTFMNVAKGDTPVVATLGFYIISMDMFLSKCKLVKKKDETFYIAPPSEKYQDPKTGKDVYGNFFWFGDKSSDFFQKEALKAINTYCLSKGMPNPMMSSCRPSMMPSERSRSMDEYADSTQSSFKNASSLAESYIK